MFITSILIFIFFIFFRSDPTENDSVEGLRPNARGPGLVTFGVSSVYFLPFFFLFIFLNGRDGDSFQGALYLKTLLLIKSIIKPNLYTLWVLILKH